jgi:hypothetical protein
MIKRQIKSVEQIFKLANKGKAVYVVSWKRSCAAAFLISCQARMLVMMVKNGQIYNYQKKK